MERKSITVEEVAADPTNAYQITVHGDVAIETLTIHGDEDGHGWVYIKYANGGSSAGTPKHWSAYVRYIEDEPENEDVADVREFYGNTAAALVAQGWTVNSAINHVIDSCDRMICTGEHDDEQFIACPRGCGYLGRADYDKGWKTHFEHECPIQSESEWSVSE